MDPTVQAALVAGAAAAAVGVVGFSAAIRTTRLTIAADHENRVWDKKAAAYEAALTELMNRETWHQIWKESNPKTWTTTNVKERLDYKANPEWSAAEARLRAYSSPQILTALTVARDADQEVSKEMDRAKESLHLGNSEIAVERTLTPQEHRDLIGPVEKAMNKSLDRDRKLIGLVQCELLGQARDRRRRIWPWKRPAIEAPREVHLHFHGVTAEDASAILAHVNREDG